MPQTANALPGRANNFDALRLLAAVSVIFSHAFLIAEGTQRHEPLIRASGNQAVLGLAGVFVFFAISGFLVTQSYESTDNPLHFLIKRSLRIFPALFVVTLLSAFALGPLVTSLPMHAYLSRPGPYRYVLANTLLDPKVHTLPGVMFVRNPVGLEINGPLWSLSCEFAMYIMVMALGMLGALRVRTALLLLALGMACIHFPALKALFGGWGWTLGFFAAGMALYKLRETRIFDGRVALIALAGLVASMKFGGFILFFPLTGCYLALWLALSPRLPPLPATRFGDLSYGLYITGWPVEQTVMRISGGRLAWWQLFLLALPVAGSLAFLSWHLVESRALRLKPGTRRRVQAMPAPHPALPG